MSRSYVTGILTFAHLLSGIFRYNEAIMLTKSWQDQVWQASALEGLAVTLVVQATLPKHTINGVGFAFPFFTSRAKLTSRQA